MPHTVYRNSHDLLTFAANLERSLHAATRSTLKPITQVPVSSTMFSHIGHDGEGTLEVVYKSTGKAYRATGVPPAIFRELLEAESLGLFFNKSIRGKYTFEAVPVEKDEEKESEPS